MLLNILHTFIESVMHFRQQNILHTVRQDSNQKSFIFFVWYGSQLLSKLLKTLI